MTFEATLRITEIIMALAFLQQSAEHIAAGPAKDRWLFGGRAVACLGLLSGGTPLWWLGVLCLISLRMLARFDPVFKRT